MSGVAPGNCQLAGEEFEAPCANARPDCKCTFGYTFKRRLEGNSASSSDDTFRYAMNHLGGVHCPSVAPSQQTVDFHPMVTPQFNSPPLQQQRKRSRFLRPITIVVALLVTWVVAGFFLFVTPQSDRPVHADVLFVLGPPDQRLEYAEKLMREGYAPTLAVSVPRREDGEFDAEICKAERTYRIVCFYPQPFTTQGEARALRDLSSMYGWKKANVITPPFHLVRAKAILSRCYTGEMHMVADRRVLPPIALHHIKDSWAYHYVYQTAAFVKLALNPGC